jgi:dipeptidyl aminopeptidase/acylaminoacyl peptidase
MRSRGFPALFILISVLLAACAAEPAVDVAYNPAFFYLTFPPGSSGPSLVLQDTPQAAPRKTIALNPPTDCSFYALRPAPRGRWVAVEWECAFGPTVELFDTVSGDSHFALSDPTIDSRFLTWQPDGHALYLKIGTLSIPQTLRVDAATGKASELPISPFAYDLTTSPDGSRIYFALSKGIGFGSEAWLAGPDGQNPSQLLVDAQNIIALAQYSPDGSQIAFIKFPDSQNSNPPGELWVMDPAGFNARELAPADAGRGFAPVWSADGSKLAFVGRDQQEQTGLPNLSVYDLARAALATFSANSSTQPVWSPDGELVAFSASGNSALVQGTPLVETQGDTMELWFYEVSSGKAYKLKTDACCSGWIR